jgi:hypothetical protein
MPSTSYRRWRTIQAKALDEIERAHAAVEGTKRGRRYATRQINQAYAVLLAAQFQRYCRDLHSECVDYLVASVAPHPSLQNILEKEFTGHRQLDRGNAQSSSLGADFGRLGLEFWTEANALDPRNAASQALLDALNNWRNAIAHQSFDPARLGGITMLRLGHVRRYRIACNRLARAFDEVMHRHLKTLTGNSPW